MRPASSFPKCRGWLGLSSFKKIVSFVCRFLVLHVASGADADKTLLADCFGWLVLKHDKVSAH